MSLTSYRAAPPRASYAPEQSDTTAGRIVIGDTLCFFLGLAVTYSPTS